MHLLYHHTIFHLDKKSQINFYFLYSIYHTLYLNPNLLEPIHYYYQHILGHTNQHQHTNPSGEHHRGFPQRIIPAIAGQNRSHCVWHVDIMNHNNQCDCRRRMKLTIELDPEIRTGS